MVRPWTRGILVEAQLQSRCQRRPHSPRAENKQELEATRGETLPRAFDWNLAIARAPNPRCPMQILLSRPCAWSDTTEPEPQLSCEPYSRQRVQPACIGDMSWGRSRKL